MPGNKNTKFLHTCMYVKIMSLGYFFGGKGSYLKHKTTIKFHLYARKGQRAPVFLVGFSVTPILYRLYGVFQAFLVEEALSCPHVYYFRHKQAHPTILTTWPQTPPAQVHTITKYNTKLWWYIYSLKIL